GRRPSGTCRLRRRRDRGADCGWPAPGSRRRRSGTARWQRGPGVRPGWGPCGRRGGPSAPRRGRRSRAARREWRGTVSWEPPPTPDLLLQRERSGGALVIHVERDLERGQQLAAGLHPCRGDGCPGLALVRQREAHALDGRADGQALVEKAKG